MPDTQTLNAVLGAYGLSNAVGNINSGGGINWGWWIANFLFGIIGMCTFGYGWKEKKIRPIIIGIALMIYPYFVFNAILAFAIGIALTAALYFWRE